MTSALFRSKLRPPHTSARTDAHAPSRWWWDTWKVLSGGRLGLEPYSASRSPHACSSVFSPRLDLPAHRHALVETFA